MKQLLLPAITTAIHKTCGEDQARAELWKKGAETYLKYPNTLDDLDKELQAIIKKVEETAAGNNSDKEQDEAADATEGLTGEAAKERIDGWKLKHKQGIFAVESEGHIAYFKNPNRHEMNLAMSKASIEKPLEMYEELAQMIYIGGSEELMENDSMFFGLCSQLRTILEGRKARLVNL